MIYVQLTVNKSSGKFFYHIYLGILLQNKITQALIDYTQLIALQKSQTVKSY